MNAVSSELIGLVDGRSVSYNITRDISLIVSLMSLNARPALVAELFPYIKIGRYKEIKREVDTISSKPFEFKKIANSVGYGWVDSNREGFLIANLLFNEAKALYPNFDFDNDNVFADMLVNVCISFNKRFQDLVDPIDINQVNSLFCGISKQDLYPNRCSCGRFYLRTTQSFTSSCPWCRCGVNPKSVKTIKLKKVNIHHFVQEQSVRVQHTQVANIS